MANMHRMTITVPESVKEQMNQIKDQVNWSAVASEAFQRKVVEIKSRRSKAMTKQQVIERLKSAGEADPKGFEAGRRFGRKWAEEKALPRYLRNIAKFPEAGFVPYYDPEDPDPNPVRLSYRLAGFILDEDSDSWKEFWAETLGPDGDTLADKEDLARGFVTGAMELWNEVKEEL